MLPVSFSLMAFKQLPTSTFDTKQLFLYANGSFSVYLGSLDLKTGIEGHLPHFIVYLFKDFLFCKSVV